MSYFPPDRPSVPTPSGDAIRRLLPRYKLVLHRNADLDLMFVVRGIMELTRFPRAEATNKMWETHHQGTSILLTTYLERAELYVEQFAGKGLRTTLEPVAP